MSQKSDDEAEMFRQAMQGVRPLEANNKIIPKRQKSQGNLDYRKQQAQVVESTIKTAISIKNNISSEEVIAHAQSGLSSSQYADLKKGNVSIQARLDLHGYTLEGALLALEDFFSAARENEFRCLLIIHGKGQHNNAVIKNTVFAFLNAQSDILAFHSAPPKLGGTGAVLVLLKRLIPNILQNANF